MCAQLHNQPPQLPPVGPLMKDKALGIPPHEAQISLQMEATKELVNKLAWALGSAYRRPYSNMRTPAREAAWSLVKQVIRDHGYPHHLAK